MPSILMKLTSVVKTVMMKHQWKEEWKEEGKGKDRAVCVSALYLCLSNSFDQILVFRFIKSRLNNEKPIAFVL